LTVSAANAVVTVPLATPVAKRPKNHRRFDPGISTLPSVPACVSKVQCVVVITYCTGVRPLSSITTVQKLLAAVFQHAVIELTWRNRHSSIAAL
jgi:hypothetical protein